MLWGGRLWRSANKTVQAVDGVDSYSVECVAMERFIPPKGLLFDSGIDCTSFEQMVSTETRPVSPWQEDGDDVVLLEGSPQRRSPQPKPATVDTALKAEWSSCGVDPKDAAGYGWRGVHFQC